MTKILDREIGDIVRENIEAASVFERFGLDYCCNPKPRLRDACERKGVDPETVAGELAHLTNLPPEISMVDGLGPSALIEHIVEEHHDLLRKKLPLVETLWSRAAHKHGKKHPELKDVLQTFRAFRYDVEIHLRREEEILFPHIQLLEIAFRIGSVPASEGRETVRNPISVMEHDHDQAEAAMSRLRSLTEGFHAPPGACNSWKLAVFELAEMERDLHIHMAKENYVLHRLAKEMEDVLTKARRGEGRMSAVLRRLHRDRDDKDGHKR